MRGGRGGGKKGRGRGKGRGGGGHAGVGSGDTASAKGEDGGDSGYLNRENILNKAVDEIILNMDRYHQWWTGPEDSNLFKPAKWSHVHTHSETSNAIFTTAMIQGRGDFIPCSTPNDYKLFFGTARKVFTGDIVVAVEAGSISEEAKNILNEYKVIAYELPADLCSRATNALFCGNADERVPASVFRYSFYEKWAAAYSSSSLILITDFRDSFFQSDPFSYHKNQWFPQHQLILFQEFHPNMVINRCSFNRRVMRECYGDDTLRTLGDNVIISSGAAMGSRDAILVWSHSVTTQLQEAPGRMVETRCASGGIDHAIINWLGYTNLLNAILKIKIFPQGEGPVNTVGGLKPNTVLQANITVALSSIYKEGRILNWNGDVSPVVHQLDHFLDDLVAIADKLESKSPKKFDSTDKGWRAVLASKCALWEC